VIAELLYRLSSSGILTGLQVTMNDITDDIIDITVCCHIW